MVVAGATDRFANENQEGVQWRVVEKVVRHPQYSGRPSHCK